MNWDQASGMWHQFKGSVRERWGKLTDDDLAVIDGKRDRLVGKIQERYGLSRDQAEQQIAEWKIPSAMAEEPAKRKVG